LSFTFVVKILKNNAQLPSLTVIQSRDVISRLFKGYDFAARNPLLQTANPDKTKKPSFFARVSHISYRIYTYYFSS